MLHHVYIHMCAYIFIYSFRFVLSSSRFRPGPARPPSKPPTIVKSQSLSSLKQSQPSSRPWSSKICARVWGFWAFWGFRVEFISYGPGSRLFPTRSDSVPTSCMASAGLPYYTQATNKALSQWSHRAVRREGLEGCLWQSALEDLCTQRS